ncbi:N-6 DNA methylase [Bifidobacterium boum]|uniref:N-6 DNA methylase n=1 Tax=Bifidobacterium boum TaxID=78343 RepID=UPI001F0F7A36|nr:N-6 DNA methylase [Bifidobacterium boum]
MLDPTCGSGSLLLTVRQELKNANGGTMPADKHVHFYGQELNRTTYNLARMNLMMHDAPYQWMDLRNADTLEQDWPDGTDFQRNRSSAFLGFRGRPWNRTMTRGRGSIAAINHGNPRVGH